MAQASSSKMVLDAVDVLLAASLASHPPAPHRQTSRQQFELTTSGKADGDDDYDSDGICTPHLPPDYGVDALSKVSNSSEYFALHSHHQAKLGISNTLNSTISTSSNRRLLEKAPPSSVCIQTNRPPDDKLAETISRIGDTRQKRDILIKVEDIDPLEEVIIPIPKRRGKPVGSRKAKILFSGSEITDKIINTVNCRGRPADPGKGRGLPVGHKNTRGLLEKIMEKSMASSSHEKLDNSGSSTSPAPDQSSILKANERWIDHPHDLNSQTMHDLPSAVQEEEPQKVEAQEEQEKEKLPSPEKGLIPDFVFEPVDDSMFEKLRAFLDQGDAQSTVSSSDEDEDGEGVNQEDYERRRLKKLRANEAMLSRLGLGLQPSDSPIPVTEVEEEENFAPMASPRSFKKKTFKTIKSIKVDADGTTTSLPPLDCTFEVACVDIPVLRPRTRSQYILFEDITVLLPLPEIVSDEEELSPLPSPTYFKKVPQKMGQKRVLGIVRRAFRGEALEGEGTTCHQCRRKTEDPKMRCRYHENGRVCPLFYCKRCLDVRYAIEWDEESRTFHCPRCLAYCNCSLCLRKAGLSLTFSGLDAKLQDEEGNKIHLSVKHYLDTKVGRPVKIGPGGLPANKWTSKKSQAGEEPSIDKKKAKRQSVEERLSKKVMIKRKANSEESLSEPKKKRQHTKKDQIETHDEVMEETPVDIPAEGKRSRFRTIKLSFKAKASAEEEEQKRQRLKHEKAAKAVNIGRGRRVQFANPPPVTKARVGRPPSKDTVSQIIEAANVWVKSKADVAPPSSSDSELEESTWRTEDEDSEEELGMRGDHHFGVEDSDMYSELDDGAVQDMDGDEGISSIQGTADSPQAGQVEFIHHPELTIDNYQTNETHSVFQSNGLLPFVEDTHAALNPPAGPALTEFIQHLLGAGVI